MAVQFETEHQRGSIYSFDPADLVIKADLNGRHELPDIEWLIQDIVAKGQLQPVLIRSEEGKPVLTAGFSRWRAIVAINSKKLTPVPLKISCVYFRGNELDGFKANIAENRFRNATSPLDDAHAIARLEKWGQTVDQIAELYREKTAWVKNRLKLISLEPEAQKAVKDGRLKVTAAAHISKLSAEQQRKAVAGSGKVKASPKKSPNGSISMAEFRKAHEYLRDKSSIENVAKLAAATLKFIAGELPEPDYFSVFKKMVK